MNFLDDHSTTIDMCQFLVSINHAILVSGCLVLLLSGLGFWFIHFLATSTVSENYALMNSSNPINFFIHEEAGPYV
jgi:cytochrome b subunit of formate dehydrogenase